MGAIALRAMPSSEPLTAEQLRRMHFERLIVSSDRGPEEWRKDAESVGMAISALRPVSREQVEKVWGVGAWETVADEGFVDTMGRQVFHLHCPVCDFFLEGNRAQEVFQVLSSLRRSHDGRGRGYGYGKIGGAA